MTEISFYLLRTESAHERYSYVCKLLEKAFRSGRFCYILTDSEQQIRLLDDLLWSFRPGSFIPHQIYEGQLPNWQHTMLIGHLSAPTATVWSNTIINVSSHCPENFLQVERILEILDNNETVKNTGRTRYRQYKSAGLPITTHNL